MLQEYGLSLGPGSHSRVGFGRFRESRVNVNDPNNWMKCVETYGHGVRTKKYINLTDTLAELLATGHERLNFV